MIICDCCSSIGAAKAALEGLNGANMFGNTGAHWSVVFVDIDAHYRNRTTFDAILPRESASKVTHLSPTRHDETCQPGSCFNCDCFPTTGLFSSAKLHSANSRAWLQTRSEM